MSKKDRVERARQARREANENPSTWTGQRLLEAIRNLRSRDEREKYNEKKE